MQAAQTSVAQSSRPAPSVRNSKLHEHNLLQPIYSYLHERALCSCMPMVQRRHSAPLADHHPRSPRRPCLCLVRFADTQAHVCYEIFGCTGCGPTAQGLPL